MFPKLVVWQAIVGALTIGLVGMVGCGGTPSTSPLPQTSNINRVPGSDGSSIGGENPSKKERVEPTGRGQRPPVTDKPSGAKPDHSLTAEQLCKEYEADKEAADKKYREKSLEVEGTVNGVFVTRAGEGHVSLAGIVRDPKDDNFQNHCIRLFFTKGDVEKVWNLSMNQKLKARGKGQGSVGTTFTDLADCVVVSLGPDPAITLTSDQLGKAYLDDETAADAKYRDKTLIVEGVVVELKPGEIYDSAILQCASMKDGKQLAISAAYNGDRAPDFAGLKKGDKIKVKGECGGRLLGIIKLANAKLLN
jgi:hypothetical protein